MNAVNRTSGRPRRMTPGASPPCCPYLERTGRWLRIESLVVDPSQRRSGTGRVLLAAAEQRARDWGCLQIEVTSQRSRAGAHAFYRRLGFADVCERSGRFIKGL